MNTYGQRLESALASLNRTDRDRAWLANRIGISVSALSQVIIGKTKALTSENHERAVGALGCSGLWLATGEGEMIPQGIINRQQAGLEALAPVNTAQVAIKEVADPMRSLRGILDEVPAEYRREALLDAIQAMAAWITPDTALANRARLMAEEKPSDVPRTSPKADKTRVT